MAIHSRRKDTGRGSNNSSASHSRKDLCKDIALIHKGRNTLRKRLRNAKGLKAAVEVADSRDSLKCHYSLQAVGEVNTVISITLYMKVHTVEICYEMKQIAQKRAR